MGARDEEGWHQTDARMTESRHSERRIAAGLHLRGKTCKLKLGLGYGTKIAGPGGMTA